MLSGIFFSASIESGFSCQAFGLAATGDLMMMEKLKRKTWFKLVLFLVILICLSAGLEYLFRYLDIPWQRIAPSAYLLVFVLSVINCALIGIPVVIAMSTMIVVAGEGDFFLTVLIASVGGTLGELTAYYAGYLGKRIVRLENAPAYNRLVGWMQRYGPWGIFFISLQPILPFDIAGLLAGAAKLPVWKFLLPCWAGKFPKYLLVAYLGETVLRLLPPLPF